MRCIFCKINSDYSKSVEHIVPESLGNKSHTLPRSIVCDKCNNYFAVKVESVVLNSPHFKSLRHRNEILSKKSRLPPESAFIAHPEGGKVEITGRQDRALEVNIPDSKLFELVKSGEVNELYVPIIPLPAENDVFLSRLLAKIAFESIAARVCEIAGWNDEMVENESLDSIRQYARYGTGKFWPYNMRRIYEEAQAFIDSKDKDKPQPYQVLHEFDFIIIEDIHLYFVCAIMGVEYAINLADRTLVHYLSWLRQNRGSSPLIKEHQQMI